MEQNLKKLCNILSDIDHIGIWVVNTDHEIVFQNDNLPNIFGKDINSVSDMFSETEILLMHHNQKVDFEISIDDEVFKIKFEKLDDNHDVGIIRKARNNKDLINKLMNLKKDFKEIVEEY